MPSPSAARVPAINARSGTAKCASLMTCLQEVLTTLPASNAHAPLGGSTQLPDLHEFHKTLPPPSHHLTTPPPAVTHLPLLRSIPQCGTNWMICTLYAV